MYHKGRYCQIEQKLALFRPFAYDESIQAKINNQITAPQIRVIGEKGENLGVLSREEALALTKPGVDLILIAPSANPPVGRLMSYDKYRYEQAKADRKERKAQKGSEMKQIQISARAQTHDLEVKLRKLEIFLAEGRPVEIQMRLRGREKGNKSWAMQKLNEFLGMIQVGYKVVHPAKFGGRGVQIYISKT